MHPLLFCLTPFYFKLTNFTIFNFNVVETEERRSITLDHSLSPVENPIVSDAQVIIPNNNSLSAESKGSIFIESNVDAPQVSSKNLLHELENKRSNELVTNSFTESNNNISAESNSIEINGELSISPTTLARALLAEEQLEESKGHSNAVVSPSAIARRLLAEVELLDLVEGLKECSNENDSECVNEDNVNSKENIFVTEEIDLEKTQDDLTSLNDVKTDNDEVDEEVEEEDDEIDNDDSLSAGNEDNTSLLSSLSFSSSDSSPSNQELLNFTPLEVEQNTQSSLSVFVNNILNEYYEDSRNIYKVENSLLKLRYQALKEKKKVHCNLYLFIPFI